MAKLVDLNLRPDDKTLRQFGFVAVAGFGLIAWMAFREAGVFRFGLGEARMPLVYGLLAVGLSAGMFSLVHPKANLPVFVGLSVLFFPVGLVVSYVLLGVLFFCVIGPIALLVRLLADDPMHRRYDPTATSYFTEVSGRRANESYFRQF